MNATIYHNPECGTSRNTLAMIRNAGIEPDVIEYLKNPPSREQLVKMITQAGLTVREAIRILESEGFLQISQGARGGARIVAPGPELLAKAAARPSGATIFGYVVNTPEQYGVVEFGPDGRARSIFATTRRKGTVSVSPI